MIVRFKPQDKKGFMTDVRHVSSMVNFLSKLGLMKKIDKMVIGDNKLHIYYADIEKD